MTLKHIAYSMVAILALIWLIGFVPTLTHIWTLDSYCPQNDGNCLALDTIMNRVQLANVAALSLTASATPIVISFMMIPFCIWFWKKSKARNKQHNKKA